MTMTPRIPVSPGAVNPAGSIDVYADYDRRIRNGRAEVTTAGRPAGALDQLTHELVRLRNAELQGCHY